MGTAGGSEGGAVLVPVRPIWLAGHGLPRQQLVRLHMQGLLQADTLDLLVFQPRVLRLRHRWCRRHLLGHSTAGGSEGGAFLVPVRPIWLAGHGLPRQQLVRLHMQGLLQADTLDLLVFQPRVLWLLCLVYSY